MKKIISVLLAIILIGAMFCSCGKKQWVCDWCETSFSGDAYYSDSLDDTLCADCAQEYWFPLPYRSYVKP